jgi:hypothetical protein
VVHLDEQHFGLGKQTGELIIRAVSLHIRHELPPRHFRQFAAGRLYREENPYQSEFEEDFDTERVLLEEIQCAALDIITHFCVDDLLCGVLEFGRFQPVI